MSIAFWPVAVVIAYLFGSINFAVLITRAVSGADIREMGNRNPGAANVGRTLGTRWGAIVLILDISKSIVPIALARAFIDLARPEFEPLLMLTVGFAAVLGHCKPLYYGFRGGRGIATSIGVYIMIVPVEALAALFGAAGIVALVFRNVEHKFGPYTPIFFVVLAPILAAATTLLLDIPLPLGIAVGGHSWYSVISVVVLSLCIVALNPSYLGQRIDDYREGRDPSVRQR